MKFYEGPGAESTAPAYEMLLRAQMAKDNAVGSFLAPLTQALDRNRQLAMQQQELDQRTKAQASEDAWKKQYGSLQERELGLKTRQMDRADKSDAASAAAFTQMMGGGAPVEQPMGGAVTPRQSPVFKGAAESLLAPRQMQGGSSQAFAGVDPKLVAAMTPADRIQFMAMHDRLQEHAAMNEKRAMDAQIAQAKQAEAAQNVENTRALIGQAADSGAIPKESAASYAQRLSMGDADRVGKELQGRIDEHIKKTGWETFRESAVKEAEGALKKLNPIPGATVDPGKAAQIAMIAASWEHSTLPYDKREEGLRKELADVLGVGKPKEKDPGVDVPGVGQNITPTTAITRGGTYKLDTQGSPVLPRDIDAEATNWAMQKLSHNPLFDSNMLATLGMLPKDDATAQQLKKSQDALLNQTKVELLHQFGWKSSAEDFGDTIGTKHASEGQMPFSTDAQAKAPTQELFKTLETLPSEAARRAAIEEHLFGADAVKQRKAKDDAEAIKSWERQQRIRD